MNILIVDDNIRFSDALKFMIVEHFSDRITEILTAKNGVECMEILLKKSVDIVFMDKEMPIMDGVETTKKAVDMYRDIKIIAVSFHSIIKEEITPEIISKCLTKF